MQDTVEITSARFLETLLGPLEEPDVGMTGPQVTAADGTTLDAGQAFRDGRYAPVFTGATPEDPGPFGALLLSREVSGLQGACLALRRSTYADVGGLSEELAAPDSLVDLAFKVRGAGYRIVWVNDARLRDVGPQPGAATGPNDPLLTLRWQLPARDVYLPQVTGS